MPTKTLALGKKPATHDPRDLLLARYTAALPPLPAGPLGHASLLPGTGWGMLGNDSVGDCVLAGGDHEVMLWNAERGRAVTFSDSDALSDYSAITGYDPNDPSTDQGTDMRNAMLYRKHTGLRDSLGKRHKITAFAALAAGDVNQAKQSIYLFSIAAVGIEFPSSAMDQFNSNQPWVPVHGAKIEGGHYVPLVGYDPAPDMFYCVTWGRIQPVTPAFLAKYMDEGFAPLSSENRTKGKTPEGFAYTQLLADLKAIGGTS